jgi:hypothetical protein
LIEHWDGTFWSIVSSPNASINSSTSANNGNYLNSVTCISESDCWAVGYAYPNGTAETLIEHWDGTSWAILPSANPSNSYNSLTGITCVSASDCWAVGHSAATGSIQTLIEHWDGTMWAVVSSPNVTSTNYLSAVSCASSTDCWAVGYDLVDANPFNEQTLVEHWDGASWAVVNSPSATATTDNHLSAVTCMSASECWAVGQYIKPSGARVDQTLIELWDGNSWSIVSSANTSATYGNGLQAVACTSASQCWAVGWYSNGHTLQALTEFISPAVQLVNAVSRKAHGGAGVFDIDLTNGNGIECRSGGPNGDYTLVFTFANPLTSVDSASVTTGTGNISTSGMGPNPNQYTVNLTGVAGAEYVTVSLTNVTDSAGNFSSLVSVPMGVLIGDTTADKFVDSADIGLTKSQSGKAVNGSNFRADLNGDGFIDSADIAFAKSKSGTALR